MTRPYCQVILYIDQIAKLHNQGKNIHYTLQPIEVRKPFKKTPLTTPTTGSFQGTIAAIGLCIATKRS